MDKFEQVEKSNPETRSFPEKTPDVAKQESPQEDLGVSTNSKASSKIIQVSSDGLFPAGQLKDIIMGQLPRKNQADLKLFGPSHIRGG